MSQRASKLVRLLDQLRRLSLPEDQIPKELPVSNGASDEYRPPKRPWEDVSHDDGGGPSAADGHRQEVSNDRYHLQSRCSDFHPISTQTTISHKQLPNKIWRLFVANAPPVLLVMLQGSPRASTGREV